MKNHWKISKLADVCKVIPGYAFKSSDFQENGIPVIKIKNITEDYSVDTCSTDFVRKEFIESIKMIKYILRNDDFIIAMTGATVGKVWKVRYDWVLLLNQRVAKFEPFAIQRDFLWCLLRHPIYQKTLKNLADGAAQPNMSNSQIENIEIAYPEALDEQRRIASILSAYDDLIENNTKRIRILENMAEELYKEWFVRFRFPGYENVGMVESGTEFWVIPEGWEVKNLWTSSQIIKGIAYKSSELSETEWVHFINLKCFNRGGWFRLNGLKKYTWKYNDSQIVNAGDIVMAVTDMTQNREVVARVAIIPRLKGNDLLTLSCDVIKIVPIEISKDYLYYLLRFSAFSNTYKARANWANVLHLRPDEIKDFQFLQPTEEVLNRFNLIVWKNIREMDILSMYNSNLTETRDSLLKELF